MKKDLVLILLTDYADRIQPSIPSEVKDIADATGFSPIEVCEAMNIALDELEATEIQHAKMLNGAFSIEPVECNRCQMISINGIACHETSCPNSKKVEGNDE